LDGAVEFGETRLAAAVAKRRDRPVQRLLDEVVTEVERFIGSRKFDDGVCVSSSADQAAIRFFDQ
jgi:serine phosphatase RsbU (regulator of sigma subunit)